jgi:hypothetical protein
LVSKHLPAYFREESKILAFHFSEPETSCFNRGADSIPTQQKKIMAFFLGKTPPKFSKRRVDHFTKGLGEQNRDIE